MFSERTIKFSAVLQRAILLHPTALIIVLLAFHLGASLALIQCYHCRDRIHHEISEAEISTEHFSDCGSLKSAQGLECPARNACSKLTVYYRHNSTSVKPIVRRSCWDSVAQPGGRNYSAGNCYWDDSASQDFRTEICICSGNYCNSQEASVGSWFWTITALAFKYFVK